MTVVNVYNNKNFDVYIGRPPQGGEWRFGNPFVIGRDGNRFDCIQKFKDWFETGNTFNCTDATEDRRRWIIDHISELKGKILGCFCYPDPCHGDILVDYASKTKTQMKKLCR